MGKEARVAQVYHRSEVTILGGGFLSGVRLGAILKKFEKRFGSSAPDLTHQLNFQSAVQGSGESLHQWSDRVLTLATRAFPQRPEHASPQSHHKFPDLRCPDRESDEFDADSQGTPVAGFRPSC